MAVALLYLWMAKPLYEARALLQIGSIGSKLLEEPASLKVKLESMYRINDSNVQKEYPLISSVSIPKKAKGLLRLTALGYDNAGAAEKIREVIGVVESEHGKIVQNYIALKQKELSVIRQKAERLREQIESVMRRIDAEKREGAKRSSERDDPASSVAYSWDLDGLYALQTLRADTEVLIRQTEMELSAPNLRKSRQVGEVTLYDHPVEPKRGVILAVAMVSGFLLGIFAIFILETIAREEDSGC